MSEGKFTAKKIDACCYRIKIGKEYIGVWCPKSKIMVIDGYIAGVSDNIDDLEQRLTKVETMQWSLK